MPSPPTIPFVEALRGPINTCIGDLNALIVQRNEEGFDFYQVIPCPGKNWLGASEYHWIVVWRPRIPTP
jgi:hypothetical protein